MSEILSRGFKIGGFTIDKAYCKTMAEITTMDETVLPNVYPIWCTDDSQLYIFYRDIDNITSVQTLNQILLSDNKIAYLPTVGADGSLTWELKIITTEVPAATNIKGAEGKSAFQTWKDNGHTEGTEAEFLAFIKGETGAAGTNGTNGVDGKSSYQIWLDAGHTGTEAEFLSSLITGLSDTQKATLKTMLGIDTILSDIAAIQAQLNP